MKKLETKRIFNWGWCWRRSRIVNTNGGRGLPLPPHILKVIFSKLPFSNLPACRLVCKSWNHLVLEYASSTEFLPNAFLLSTSDNAPNPTHRRFMCNPKFHCIAIDTMTSVASLGFYGDWSTVLIINSCNGLLFISKTTYDHFSEGILNPITNEFIEVPQPGVEDDIYSYGLGFTSTKKQYKLFRVTPVTHFRTNSPCIMEVFRFGRRGSNHNQWRHVLNLPFEICYEGAYSNGVIYWVGKEIDKENEYLVYALDVETEKIEPIAILEVDPSSSPMHASIEPFNHGIYVTIYMNNPYKFQVWMMLGKDSCIREFVIDDIPKDWVHQFLHLVKVFEDGRIFFQVRDDLFCLDNSGRKIKMETFNPNERQVRGFCHIESLNFGYLPDILAGEN